MKVKIQKTEKPKNQKGEQGELDSQRIESWITKKSGGRLENSITPISLSRQACCKIIWAAQQIRFLLVNVRALFFLQLVVENNIIFLITSLIVSPITGRYRNCCWIFSSAPSSFLLIRVKHYIGITLPQHNITSV